MTIRDIYLSNERYHAALDRLEELARTFDPAAPDELRSRIIEVVGDLGVWPESCCIGQDEGEVTNVALALVLP